MSSTVLSFLSPPLMTETFLPHLFNHKNETSDHGIPRSPLDEWRAGGSRSFPSHPNSSLPPSRVPQVRSKGESRFIFLTYIDLQRVLTIYRSPESSITVPSKPTKEDIDSIATSSIVESVGSRLLPPFQLTSNPIRNRKARKRKYHVFPLPSQCEVRARLTVSPRPSFHLPSRPQQRKRAKPKTPKYVKESDDASDDPTRTTVSRSVQFVLGSFELVLILAPPIFSLLRRRRKPRGAPLDRGTSPDFSTYSERQQRDLVRLLSNKSGSVKSVFFEFAKLVSLHSSSAFFPFVDAEADPNHFHGHPVPFQDVFGGYPTLLWIPSTLRQAFWESSSFPRLGIGIVVGGRGGFGGGGEQRVSLSLSLWV